MGKEAAEEVGLNVRRAWLLSQTALKGLLLEAA